MSKATESGVLLRILLPNKQRTVLQVREDEVLQDVLNTLCEKRQYDVRDFMLTHENQRKKEEEIDLTLQVRQYDHLEELTLQRIKRKSFLLPASSKGTNLRTMEPVQPPSPTPSLPQEGGGSKEEGAGEGEKKKGRLRSISASFRPTLTRKSSSKSQLEEAREALGGSRSHDHLPAPLERSVQFLSLTDTLLNDPSLAAFMSEVEAPSSPVKEIKDVLLTVPPMERGDTADDLTSSAEEITREKIILKGDASKTMTLQKKKLRPRAATVTDRVEAKAEEEVVLRCLLPSGHQTAIKVFPSTSMEQILKTICEKKALDFEAHTLRLPGKDDEVDLDRPLSYFNMTQPQVLVVPSKEKSYSTMCVSEGDRDVMILNYQNGRLEVVQATEEKLIEKLTDEQETDKKFLDSVLLTYRSFMSPTEFLDCLLGRFNSEPPEHATEEELRYFTKWIDPVRNKVLVVIREWITSHWHDFVFDEELKQNLTDFITQASNLSHLSEEVKTNTRTLLQLIQTQNDSHLGRERRRQSSLVHNVLKWGGKDESPLLHFKSVQVAEQLCLINHGLFESIDGIEFLNQLWRSGSREELQCPNLLRFIDRFNKESSWAATEICLTTDFHKRVRLLKKMINITKESFDRHNFFSGFSLLAGLNLTPVQKLKKTWAALPAATKKVHEECEKLSNPSRNMKAYRDHQAHCQPPILPFIPIYLKDLIFYNDGNSSRLNNLVNYEKLRMMSDMINNTLALAAIPFPFEEIPEIRDYLLNPYVEKLEELTHRVTREGFEA